MCKSVILTEAWGRSIASSRLAYLVIPGISYCLIAVIKLTNNYNEKPEEGRKGLFVLTTWGCNPSRWGRHGGGSVRQLVMWQPQSESRDQWMLAPGSLSPFHSVWDHNPQDDDTHIWVFQLLLTQPRNALTHMPKVEGWCFHGDPKTCQADNHNKPSQTLSQKASK